MNFTSKVIEKQLHGLLKQVEQYRLTRCNEILGKANKQAKGIVADAHHKARQRVHEEIVENRRAVQRRISAARAQLQTRQKQRKQASDKAKLRHAWQTLNIQLLQRWQVPSHRNQWIERILHDAKRLLVDQHWTVEHTPNWTAKERDELSAKIASITGHSPQLVPEEAIDAGMRICADGACIDGTIAGLMSDQSHLESKLLVEIQNL